MFPLRTLLLLHPETCVDSRCQQNFMLTPPHAAPPLNWDSAQSTPPCPETLCFVPLPKDSQLCPTQALTALSSFPQDFLLPHHSLFWPPL